eukprot:TRINITY_DN12809_c0_g1_i1.p1 TRINITY_DN12809_c0_g1~~TRINITY_DN12809_c0_g1_i1.p1  ORF type:complete len:105 (-),score=24.46 TRINITY_DN12809_c0_g1_i1:277-591(-)
MNPDEDKQTDIVAAFSNFQKTPLYQSVSQLVHWKDPVISSLFFSIFLFSFLILLIGDYSFVTLGSQLILSILIFNLVRKHGTKLRLLLLRKKTNRRSKYLFLSQ